MNKKLIHCILLVCIICIGILFTIYYEYNKDDISAKNIIRLYFKYINSHDRKSLIELTQYSDEDTDIIYECDYLESARLLDIDEKKATLKKSDYPDVNKNNIKIYMVQYEAKTKKGSGVTLPIDDGLNGYNLVLIRRNKNAPWKIDDGGF